MLFSTRFGCKKSLSRGFALFSQNPASEMISNTLNSSKSYRIGVDSGGTFTDICLLNERSGELFVWKVSSTRADPSEAIAQGVGEALGLVASAEGVTPEVTYFGHGTTVATNALIEKRGARTALLTTEGMRDLLELARQRRPALYDLHVNKPAPLVSRDMRYELRERVLFDGVVETPLAEADIRLAARLLAERGIESVAVCFLFSFVHPQHEAMVKRILAEELPNTYVCVSHEISPEYREFERLSTVVMNAYVGPVMQGYLDRLGPRLNTIGIDTSPYLTQSSGGIISCATAGEQPVRTMLSGPAAGVTGAVAIGASAGIPNFVTFDMGGTSSDVALVHEGKVSLGNLAMIEGYPVKVPMLDIHTVGAGGGSIAHIDQGGMLQVGPRCAGASPGPVAYGAGNTEPTVTDANVVMQVLNPIALLGGRMPIDAGAAKAAIAELADRLGIDVMEAAGGIIRIVTANMVKAIRVISVDRGYDPRDYALMAFGGAGPLHAARLARELGMPRVIIPRYPGVLCASGLLLSDLRSDYALTRILRLDQDNIDELFKVRATLCAQAEAWFEEEGIAPENRSLSYTVDLRYLKQSHELNVVWVEAQSGALARSSLRDAFEEEHFRRYGYIAEGEPIQITTVRCEAVGKVVRPVQSRAAVAGGSVEDARSGERDVYFPETSGFEVCPIYDRDLLGAGQFVEGPALVEQMDSTTLVLSGQRATVDEDLNLIIEEVT